MAVTVTVTRVPGYEQPEVVGNKKVSRRKLTLATGSTYATGGFALSPSQFGLTKIKRVKFDGPFRNGTSFLVPSYSPSSGKVLLAWGAGASAALAEVANATSVASYVCEFVEAEGY
jgi:hypothetical protein